MNFPKDKNLVDGHYAGKHETDAELWRCTDGKLIVLHSVEDITDNELIGLVQAIRGKKQNEDNARIRLFQKNNLPLNVETPEAFMMPEDADRLPIILDNISKYTNWISVLEKECVDRKLDRIMEMSK